MSTTSAAPASLILYSGDMSTIVDSMTAFGERLRAARRARGWPIERLASVSGPVLLVDDLADSRWTMTVAGRELRRAGATAVLPFVLALTA